jgi:DNA-binding MarR family transcriptional regulator
MPATYEFLDAVNLRDVRTTAEVAARLAVDEADAARQLREAENAGLVFEEEDASVNVPPDFNRQVWFLTPEGHAELERLEVERGE